TTTFVYLAAIHKSIAPPIVLAGDSFVAFCDAHLAGVAENSKGLHSLELSWHSMDGFYLYLIYVCGDLTYGLTNSNTIKVTKKWEAFRYWEEQENQDIFFDTNKYKLLLKVERNDNSNDDEFCCKAEYFDSQAFLKKAKRCENVTVGQKAILHPSLAMPGESVSVFCNADLAMIPAEVSELESIKLSWKSDESNETCLYAISRDPENNTNMLTQINKRSGNHTWIYIKSDLQLASNIATLNRSSYIGINISEFQLSDSGWFCCGAAYLTDLNMKRYNQGCHYLSANGTTLRLPPSRNYTVAEYVGFGLLLCIMALAYHYLL
ncbi:uncharacterized protein LOC131932618, partial [Physella acuta]|uniref:uncharacterized protein LOC131932618 n=1 Tax=Physella acuta TaxID=109671 RepID=UPI0027DDA77D